MPADEGDAYRPRRVRQAGGRDAPLSWSRRDGADSVRLCTPCRPSYPIVRNAGFLADSASAATRRPPFPTALRLSDNAPMTFGAVLTWIHGRFRPALWLDDVIARLAPVVVIVITIFAARLAPHPAQPIRASPGPFPILKTQMALFACLSMIDENKDLHMCSHSLRRIFGLSLSNPGLRRSKLSKKGKQLRWRGVNLTKKGASRSPAPFWQNVSARRYRLVRLDSKLTRTTGRKRISNMTKSYSKTTRYIDLCVFGHTRSVTENTFLS